MASKRAIQSQLFALRFQKGESAALEELIDLWQRPLLRFSNLSGSLDLFYLGGFRHFFIQII